MLPIYSSQLPTIPLSSMLFHTISIYTHTYMYISHYIKDMSLVSLLLSPDVTSVN